jgi:hypothetical protein
LDDTSIFRWSGEYFGFISGDHLFSSDGNYLGWVEEDNTVWCADGQFLGEIVDDEYILRQSNIIEPIAKIPHIVPISPIAPIAPMNRLARMAMIGWKDALDRYP